MYTVVRSLSPALFGEKIMQIEIDSAQYFVVEQALKDYIEDYREVAQLTTYERSKECLLEAAERAEALLKELHGKALDAGYTEEKDLYI